VYEFRLLTTPARVLRWPSGSVIRVHIAAGPSAERTALLESAFINAAARWNALASYGEFQLERAADARQAQVVLSWSDVAPPVDTRGCPPVIRQGVTTFCVDFNTLRLVPYPLVNDPGAPSRITMLVTILATEASSPALVERLVMHELGHVLGLAQHSPNTSDLMWNGEPTASAPSVRDASTVQVLYHVRPEILP
jgi:predicted Zn-dependent protease